MGSLSSEASFRIGRLISTTTIEGKGSVSPSAANTGEPGEPTSRVAQRVDSVFPEVLAVFVGSDELGQGVKDRPPP